MPFHNYVIEIISAQSVFSDTSNYDYSLKSFVTLAAFGKFLSDVFFFTCIKKVLLYKIHVTLVVLKWYISSVCLHVYIEVTIS